MREVVETVGQRSEPVSTPSVRHDETNAPKPSGWKKIVRWSGTVCALTLVAIAHSMQRNQLPLIHSINNIAQNSFRNPFVPRPAATSLHMYQLGDSWEYSAYGNITYPNGEIIKITGGTMKTTITACERGKSQFNRIAQISDTQFVISSDGRNASINHRDAETFSQGLLDPATFLQADNNGPQDGFRVVLKPQQEQPGFWAAGQNHLAHVDFNNGESQDTSTSISDSQVIDTAFGKVSVWNVVVNEVDSNGTKTTSVLWFAPQIGMPVKSHMTMVLKSGESTSYDTSLTKTSVAL